MLGEVLSDGGQSFYVLAGTQLTKWVVNNNSEKVSGCSCFCSLNLCGEILNVQMKCIRVATCQGKVREKQNFLQVRELSGNFEKMSGNYGYLTNVREFCDDN